MQVHFALQRQLPPAPAEASMSKLMVVHGDLDKRCNLPIKCHSSNSLPLPFLHADPYRHLSKTDNISEKPEKTIKRCLGKNSVYIKSHTHTQLAIITKPTEREGKGGRGGGATKTRQSHKGYTKCTFNGLWWRQQTNIYHFTNAQCFLTPSPPLLLPLPLVTLR